MSVPVIWMAGLCAGALAAVGAAGVRPVAPSRSLQGATAVAHLKEQRLYASLGEAVTAARYRIEPATRPGESYVAENPSHGLRTRFEHPGATLTYAFGEVGRRHSAVGSRKPDPWSPLPLRRAEGPLPHRGGAGGELVPNTQHVTRNTQVVLTAVGRGARLSPTTATAIRADGNRVDYTHRMAGGATLTEWYLNAPTGLEHGFVLPAAPEAEEETLVTAVAADTGSAVPTLTPTLTHTPVPSSSSSPRTPGSAPNPDPSQPLTLRLALATDLAPEASADGQRLTLRDAHGEAVLAYEKLKVWDAAGRVLPARMVLVDLDRRARPESKGVGEQGAGEQKTLVTRATSGSPGSKYALRNTQCALSASRETPPYTLQLLVDDQSATYPLTIDPTWTLQQKLSASDGADFEAFGIAVAVSGDTAMVGAFQHAGAEGAVYVFERTGTTWAEVQKLTGNDAGNPQFFGGSVALVGDTAVIGAPFGNGFEGAVHVFRRSAGVWGQVQKLAASAPNVGDQFGWSVALSVNAPTYTIVTGAYTAATDGLAYVFQGDGTTWTQEAILSCPDVVGGDGFGYSVGVSGDVAVVGARFHSHGGANEAGGAYVFEKSGMSWSAGHELGAGTFVADDQAGINVAIDGTTVAVGAWGADDAPLSGNGAVSVYLWNGASGTLQQRLVASDATDNDGLGAGLALEGNRLVAGASLDADIGSAYVFDRTGATWLQQQKLAPADGVALDTYGISIALSGTTVIAGAPGHDNSTGAAYVYFAPPDPPVISDARVTTVGQTTATIAWTTDVAASSTVEYRVLGAALFSTATGSAGTSHTVTLSSLIAGRTYEYRVRSISSGGSAPASETVFPASGTQGFLTAPNLSGEVIGLALRRLAGTIYATVTYSNTSGATRSGVQLDFGTLSGTSTVNTNTSMPASLGTVASGSSATTTLEFSGGAGVSGSTAIITIGYSSSGGGSSSSYRVTLP